MGDQAVEPVELRLERHRVELTGYCYRMLGSSAEAEDAVQETMTRAWRGYERFEGRASLRSWLYRIASNVCFDLLNASQRRARPIDLSEFGTVASPIGDALPEATWIQPIPDGRVLAAGATPPSSPSRASRSASPSSPRSSTSLRASGPS